VYGFARGTPVTSDAHGNWTWLMPSPMDTESLQRRTERIGEFTRLLADDNSCWAGTSRGLLPLNPQRLTLEDALIPLGPVTALADGGNVIFAAVAPIPYDLALKRDQPVQEVLRAAIARQNFRTSSYSGDLISSVIVAIDKKSHRLYRWRIRIPGLISSLAATPGKVWAITAWSNTEDSSRNKWGLHEAPVPPFSQDMRAFDRSDLAFSGEAERIYDDPAYRLPSNWPRRPLPEHINRIRASFVVNDIGPVIERIAKSPLPSSMLIDAATHGSAPEAAAVFPLVADPYAVGNSVAPRNALQWALVRERFDIASALVTAGYNVNRFKQDTPSPLSLAARAGQVELARLMIEHGADCNSATHKGVTPLIVAVQEGHLEMARLLLDNKANAKRTVEQQRSPLEWALWSNDVPMIALLVSRGATWTGTGFGETDALSIAAMQDSVELLDALPQLGLPWRAESPRASNAFERAAEMGADTAVRYLVRKGVWSDNAIAAAERQGHLRLAHWLEQARHDRAKAPPIVAAVP
jgi:ankyrin repeat protein